MAKRLTDSEIINWFKDNPREYDFIKIVKSVGAKSDVLLKCNECGNEFIDVFERIRGSSRETCKQCSNDKISKSARERHKNNIKTTKNDSKFYVYRFIDKDNEIIYIGKTNNLNRRMKDHFEGSGHLPKECYDKTQKVEFIILNNQIDMDIYELYYINLFKPYYNTKDKTDTDTEVNLPSKKWRTFMDKDNNTNTYTFNSNAINNLKSQINNFLISYRPKKIFNNYEEVIIIEKSQWDKHLKEISNEISNLENLLLQY